MSHVKLFEAFLNEDDADKARYARVVKDLDEVRPRMAPAPKPEGMMASQATKYFDLYLQDQASYVTCDKYGYAKGIANWEWMIDQSGGAMFAATAKIANEKLQMLKDLGELEKYGKDYFARSYFDIWKDWKEFKKSGKAPVKEGQEVAVADMKSEAESHMSEIRDSLDFASAKLYDLQKMAEYIKVDYPELSQDISKVVEPLMTKFEKDIPEQLKELLKKFN